MIFLRLLGQHLRSKRIIFKFENILLTTLFIHFVWIPLILYKSCKFILLGEAPYYWLYPLYFHFFTISDQVLVDAFPNHQIIKKKM